MFIFISESTACTVSGIMCRVTAIIDNNVIWVINCAVCWVASEQQRYKMWAASWGELWSAQILSVALGPGHPGQQLECIGALDPVRGDQELTNQRPGWRPDDQSEARVECTSRGEREECRGEQKVKIPRDSQDCESSNNSYSVPCHDHHPQSSWRLLSSGGFKLLDVKEVPPSDLI